jgi:hypothetical protein
MLHNKSWALLAKPNETLCLLCFYDRMRKRSITIELEDLKPCPINMLTCFDWYAREASPDAVRTWLDEYDRALNFQ